MGGTAAFWTLCHSDGSSEHVAGCETCALGSSLSFGTVLQCDLYWRDRADQLVHLRVQVSFDRRCPLLGGDAMVPDDAAMQPYVARFIEVMKAAVDVRTKDNAARYLFTV